MGDIIRKTGSEAVERWHQKMPKFFRGIVIICACVIVTAFAVNQIMVIGGAEPHEWWRDAYPLLLSVPTGMIVVCKLTVAGGYKNIDIDALSHGNVECEQIKHSPNMSDVDTVSPGNYLEKEGPNEIEPYNDGPDA